MVYNLMTGEGFNQEGLMGAWSIAWFGLPIVFFVAVISNRWLPEMGINWNNIGSLIGGLGLYIVIITITGAAKWAILAGILGIVVGGYFIGLFFGSSDSGGGW